MLHDYLQLHLALQDLLLDLRWELVDSHLLQCLRVCQIERLQTSWQIPNRRCCRLLWRLQWGGGGGGSRQPRGHLNGRGLGLRLRGAGRQRWVLCWWERGCWPRRGRRGAHFGRGGGGGGGRRGRGGGEGGFLAAWTLPILLVLQKWWEKGQCHCTKPERIPWRVKQLT